ncbi:MAG: hypothetical protein ABI781_15065 [Burkholderiales bacterium]
MSVIDIVLVICAICGAGMVAGSIWLLRVGAIKLEAAAAGGGLTIEVVKQIRIETGVPALGLFLIGLLFEGLALHCAPPPDVPTISVSGTTHEVYPNASVVVSADIPDARIRAAGKQVLGTARPALDEILITVTAPNFNPYKQKYSRVAAAGGVKLRDVTLTRSGAEFGIPSEAELPRAEPGAPEVGVENFGKGSQP